MSDQNKIKCLEHHIQNLLEEISLIDIKNPRLSAEEYLTEKTKLQTLRNLKAIARNELNSLLHQYRFTLRGKIQGSKGEIYEKVVRNRVFTEINCNASARTSVKMGPAVSQPLIDIIQKDYSTYFVEGKFEIKRIKKIR